MRRLSLFVTAMAALGGLLQAAPAAAFDYPTAERVNYVMACMRDNPGPHYEMVNKCSCAIDALARDVSLDDFVAMSTATNANSIGGERGSYIRDSEELQAQIRKFRELQAAARKGCFIQPGPR
ncbi:MAG TPA: hypothetical protein VFL86_07520 [Burkholderiaceae bacterium]|nr:hypothetical protein [Burkholderiaceae bacterium]